MQGAKYSYAMLWVVVLSAVFGTAAQYLAAKIGILENRGIIATTQDRLGNGWAWIIAMAALLATWLAAIVLMNALAGVTSLVTGIYTPFWGIPYGAMIGSFIVWKGYRWFETVCKLFVGFVVSCFIATLFMADISYDRLIAGLVFSVPGGMDGASHDGGHHGRRPPYHHHRYAYVQYQCKRLCREYAGPLYQRQLLSSITVDAGDGVNRNPFDHRYHNVSSQQAGSCG